MDKHRQFARARGTRTGMAVKECFRAHYLHKLGAQALAVSGIEGGGEHPSMAARALIVLSAARTPDSRAKTFAERASLRHAKADM
jgi:hypothetical protein